MKLSFLIAVLPFLAAPVHAYPQWLPSDKDYMSSNVFDYNSVKDLGNGMKSVVAGSTESRQVYRFAVHCPTWRFTTVEAEVIN